MINCCLIVLLHLALLVPPLIPLSSHSHATSSFSLQAILQTLTNEYTDWTRPLDNGHSMLDSLSELLGDAETVSGLVESLDHQNAHNSLARLAQQQSSAAAGRESARSSKQRDRTSINHPPAGRIFFYVFSHQVSSAIPHTFPLYLCSLSVAQSVLHSPREVESNGCRKYQSISTKSSVVFSSTNCVCFFSLPPLCASLQTSAVQQEGDHRPLGASHGDELAYLLGLPLLSRLVPG